MKYLLLALAFFMTGCTVVPEHYGVARNAMEIATYTAIKNGVSASEIAELSYNAGNDEPVKIVDLAAVMNPCLSSYVDSVLTNYAKHSGNPMGTPHPGRMFSHDTVTTRQAYKWINDTAVNRIQ